MEEELVDYLKEGKDILLKSISSELFKGGKTCPHCLKEGKHVLLKSIFHLQHQELTFRKLERI